MTRLMFLDSGEELGETNCGALASAGDPVRLKLLEPAPPFQDGQIIQVAPLDAGRARPRDLLLIRSADGFRLGLLRHGQARDGEEALGRVVAVERGPATFPLERGFLSRVPIRWLPRAIDALELLWRLRHPLTPSLYLGSGEDCLEGVRAKYDRLVEARQYSHFALADLHPFEREILEKHVRPRGRVLDIGCGAGREALGFARAGFQVVAIDIAPRMIQAARANAEREGLDITFKVQSATDLDEPPGSFDGVFWSGSYQHIPGRDLRIATLRRIGRALSPDSPLILMVVYQGKRGVLSRSRLVDFLRRALRKLGRISSVSEPGDGYMREVSEASDPWEACFFHEFSGPADLRVELEAAGFRGEEVIPGWWVCRKAPL
jgi:SAM-dependent methyltransferase